ncbi:MAG: UDP-N-acetylmuramate dehydrogenase [Rikenellaceae bacterium]|nr:UDP-N-acetylmuramate dehydrogenase [Rikenellaceae bacterium]
MKIKNNVSLRDKHTLHCECYAETFIDIDEEDDLILLDRNFSEIYKKAFFIGEGSDILITKNSLPLVIHCDINFIKILEEDLNNVIVCAGGGTKWDDLVDYCVNNNWWGVENLSGIPSSCAVAPIQNIGAYGAEFSEVAYRIYGYNFETHKFEIFTPNDLSFSYRKSKLQQMPEIFITKIEILLNKNPQPNLSYKDLKNKFLDKNPSLKEIRNTVLEIRDNKIPNPDKIGNAGSFFKNPICSKNELEILTKKFPDICFFQYSDDKFKISAAWLIEKAGWKGYREGDAGVSTSHSLILVNYGNATGQDILNLANKIIDSVKNIFDIKLEPEVKIL